MNIRLNNGHSKLYKILIVDDTIANIDLLVDVLSSKQYELSVATSGLAALNIIKRDLPDLILLDVMMPKMSGYEVCQQLKSDTRTQHLPIIFVTAKADIEDMVKGFQLGAVDYLIKPIQQEEVRVRVNTHLQMQYLIKTEQKRSDELQQLNRKLQQQKETAEKATALKDQFVSLVAHDLRSPFNAMLGYIQYLGEDDEQALTEYQQDIVDKVLKSGHQQLAMIDEILNIGRLQSGKITPHFEFIDAYHLVQAAMDKNGLLAEKKGINIVNEIPKQTRMYADFNLMIEVIYNLIANSIKFSYAQSRITLALRIDENIIITVKDQGVGISALSIQHLFKLEKKTTTLGTAGEEGTGFGLPYCENIIQAHHGKIKVESEINQGSLFHIELPIVQPKVLIVDDDKTTALLILMLLTQYVDVQGTIVGDGKMAWQALTENKYHLIISDIHMPIMDGFELLTQVRKDNRYKKIPFILITGEQDSEARCRCFELGGDDYVCKPIKKDDLLPRIRRIIR